MKLTANAKKKDSFFLKNADLMTNDQDFMTNFINFMDDESIEKAGLNENVRQLAIISGLVGSNALDLYKELLPTALKAITPEVVKEILYQGVSYLGINQVYPFLKYTNSYYQSHHIKTSLESTHLQNNEERRHAGLKNLEKIYGKAAQDYPNSGNKNLKRMRELVTDNGFGDYYSRQTVSMETRELITFCLLEGLGGVKGELLAHAKANLNFGASFEFLLSVIITNIPYLGFPRSWEAVHALQELTGEKADY